MELFHEEIGSGESVVFLNGVMMTTQSWAQETRELSRDFRCVLHDFRGQLRSPKPSPIRMNEHVDDLVELLDRLGLARAHIVGTSYGGEVGMMFAARHPARVTTLTAIACVSHIEPDLRAKILGWIDIARTRPEELFDSTVHHNYSDAFLEAHPEFLFAGRERLRSMPEEFFRGLADLCDAFLALDIDAELPSIAAPTLIVAAEKDILKPVRYSEILARAIPNARLETIAGAGHAVVIEQPRIISEQIRAIVREGLMANG